MLLFNIPYTYYLGGLSTNICLLYLYYILFAYILYKVLESYSFHRIWILAFFYAIFICFFVPIYSPIDESSHFDYVLTLSYDHVLPNMLTEINVNRLSMGLGISGIFPWNHEAVQPPIYYIFISFLTMFIKNNIIKLYVIRFLGFAILVSTSFLIYKSIELLKSNFSLLYDQKTFNYLLFIIGFNPGIIIRFCTVSNESLAVFFSTLLIYIFINIVVSSKKCYIYYSLILMPITFLTKNTTIYLLAIFFLIMLYQKKWKVMAVSFLTFIFMISPWLLHNLVLYNSLTGINRHLELILPIVNPQKVLINIIDRIPRFFESYFLASEVTAKPLLVMVLTFFSFLSLLLFIAMSLFAFKYTLSVIKRKLQFNYSSIEKLEFIKYIFSVAFIINTLMLFVSTLTSGIDTILGRYVYLSVLPIIGYLLCNNIILNNKIKIIFIVFLSLNYIDSLYSIFDTNKVPILFQNYQTELIKDDNSLGGCYYPQPNNENRKIL